MQTMRQNVRSMRAAGPVRAVPAVAAPRLPVRAAVRVAAASVEPATATERALYTAAAALLEGVAAKKGIAAPAPAPASPVNVDIGGDGGYFDHDAGHVGLAEREEIAALFDQWNAALATRNPEVVADCYAADAVLLPTVSNEVRTTRAGIVDYFTSFTKLSPQGRIDQSQIRKLNPSLALHSGVYTFSLTPEGGATKLVQARFTFMYKKVNGVWKIAEHHSSAMPEAQPEGVDKLFDKWNAALQTGDPEAVADLYAPDGVLLPTVSNQVRTSRDAIVNYFKSFLKLKPFGTINTSIVRELGEDFAANSGIYTFRLSPEGENPREVTARFTFIYKKINGTWYIAEHHSSAMPEPVTPPAATPAAKAAVAATA